MVIFCFVYPHAAWTAPVPILAVFTKDNSDLPDNRVAALASATDGSMWVGTFGGGVGHLDKDGGWRIYSRTSTHGGLPDDRVLALALDPDGSVWVGTAGGVARLDITGRWRTYNRANTGGGLPNDRVFSLAVGSDGSLWVGTPGGVTRLNKDDQWQTYNQTTTGGGLPDDRVLALAVGPGDSLWVGTEGGLAWFKDGRWQTYSRFNTDGGLPSDGVSALTVGSDGSLWVGTQEGRVIQFKDRRWRPHSLNTNSYLLKHSVFALAFAPDDSLWIGSEGGGLSRFDKSGHWETYSRSARANNRLPDDRILALAFASDGSLWIGTDGSGLVRLDRDGDWQVYNRANTGERLPSDSILALAVGAEGSLWVGTEFGLARFGKDGQWQTYSNASTNEGLPNDSVSALAANPDGSLWVGTKDGLARLHADGRWQTYHREGTYHGAPISALARTPDGSLWVGTDGGLVRFDSGGRRQTYDRANTGGGLPADAVVALAAGTDGSLWVLTKAYGLARLDKDNHWRSYPIPVNEGASLLAGREPRALAPVSDGSVWIGTGDGLARLDMESHWQTYSKASTGGGLPDDTVFALTVTPDSSLWVGTESGLARLDKDGQWQSYSRASTNGGLPGDEVLALALDPKNGSVWVGTDRGLAYFKGFSGRIVRIVEVIGNVDRVTQAEQTIGVVAFDPHYMTQPGMFHYIWRMTGRGLFRDHPGIEVSTRSSVYRANFDHDGDYTLSAIAVDRYGNRSVPKHINFNVVLSQANSFSDFVASAWHIILLIATVLYIIVLIALFSLTRYYTWAFRILSDAAWARWLTWPFFILRHVPAVQRWVMEPWFQEVRLRTPADVPFLDLSASMTTGLRSEATTLLQRLRDSPRLWLHGRSGMGKSSVFAAWERAYFLVNDSTTLTAAVRRHGFVLVALAMRHYATLPVPDANRPESWVLEVVRRELAQYGFATDDIKLIRAVLKTGRIALALDGTNEADRDLALAAFASQFPQVRLLVTSQAIPRSLPGDTQWEVWELPRDISGLRDGLLTLWLGNQKGTILARRIVTEGLSGIIVSGYDLRLLADLAAGDPESASLPTDRVALYRAMLDRARGPEGEPIRLDGLRQLAWAMVTQRRRRILPDDEKTLGVGTLKALEGEGLRIIRSAGAEHEFRHDQMRAFLAASWLVEEMPTMSALHKTATDAEAFGLNRRDQEELWSFLALLLTSTADQQVLWRLTNDDPVEHGILLAALQTGQTTAVSRSFAS
jgi:ligand-binding sensor domain-containing protein